MRKVRRIDVAAAFILLAFIVFVIFVPFIGTEIPPSVLGSPDMTMRPAVVSLSYYRFHFGVVMLVHGGGYHFIADDLVFPPWS